MKRNILLAAVACMVAGGATYSISFTNHRCVIGLWLTPDQQGRYYFEKNDYKSAAERFQDPSWKGIAAYRSGNFEAAVGQFALVETADGYFNLGDAYAHLGQLEQAAASYEEALRRKPSDKEIRENLELVRSLILKRGKRKEEEPPQGEEPIFNPDEVKVDEKGKKGKAGEVDKMPLSDEQIQELWMRRLQTTPSEFLRLKFAIQAQGSEAKRLPGTSEGGR